MVSAMETTTTSPQSPLDSTTRVSASAPVADAPYHRLLRTQAGYRWWRPLVAMLVLGVLMVVAQVIILTVSALALLPTGDADPFESGVRVAAIMSDLSDPLAIVILAGSVAVGVLVAPLAMLIAGLRPVSLRHSVLGRIRWGWMARTLVPAVVFVLLGTGATFAISLATGTLAEPLPLDVGRYLVLVIVVLLLVPLQAAAEEYIFRGVILQGVGSWVRSAPVALIVSSLVFAVLHTQYQFWDLLSVLVMGVGFAIVTMRTGGLEAAIVLHVVHNTVSFLLIGSGVSGSHEMGNGEGTPLLPVVQAVLVTVWIIWIEFLARRHRIDRTALAAASV